MKYYLVTLKSLKLMKPSASLYMTLANKFMKDYNTGIGDNGFETDSKGKLHLHFIAMSDRKFLNCKKFISYCFANDIYCHVIQVKPDELEIVCRYLRKQHTCSYVFALENKECCEYFESTYGFV